MVRQLNKAEAKAKGKVSQVPAPKDQSGNGAVSCGITKRFKFEVKNEAKGIKS